MIYLNGKNEITLHAGNIRDTNLSLYRLLRHFLTFQRLLLFSPFCLFLAFSAQLRNVRQYSKADSLGRPKAARHTDQAFPFPCSHLPYPRRASLLLRLHHHRGFQMPHRPDGEHGDRGMEQHCHHLAQPEERVERRIRRERIRRRIC